MPLFILLLVILVVSLVVGAVLHPVATLRRLARFVCGLIAVLAVGLGCVTLFATHTGIEDWLLTGALFAGGCGFAVLSTTVLRPRYS